ncbi:hypothetical protein BsWGS_26011 [Bradybaena similaris]
MSLAFCLAVMVVASISVARADKKGGIRKLPVFVQTRQTTDGCARDCAHFGENCRFRTCCQYTGRSEMGCYHGRCLQADCSGEGHSCTINDPECCYDRGLACVNGTCSRDDVFAD